jgi:hypothetical protein
MSSRTDNLDLEVMTAEELRALRPPLEATRRKAEDRLLQIGVALSVITAQGTGAEK